MEDIDFREVDFVAKNLNKLQKIEFGRKNQLSPQCVHTWGQQHELTLFVVIINLLITPLFIIYIFN